LFSHGLNVDTLPAWHKRGVGLWWESYEKLGRDPRTGAEVPATRRRLREEAELPFGAEYEALVAGDARLVPHFANRLRMWRRTRTLPATL
jgi:hypothetical protein